MFYWGISIETLASGSQEGRTPVGKIIMTDAVDGKGGK
jgi:hypothetical protein